MRERESEFPPVIFSRSVIRDAVVYVRELKHRCVQVLCSRRGDGFMNLLYWSAVQEAEVGAELSQYEPVSGPPPSQGKGGVQPEWEPAR